MSLTHKQFRSLPNRAEAFTLTAYALRGGFRVLGARLADWLDAERCNRKEIAEIRRQDLLRHARELRADLDVIIAEIEAPVADAGQVAA